MASVARVLLASAGMLACASPGAAQALVGSPIAGELACRIGEGAGLAIGADRNVLCRFDRPGLVAERYEGTTGLVTAPVAPLGTAQTVTYSVGMATPDALAALAGDYDGRGDGRLGGSAVLVGGASGDIVLRPIDNRATTALAPLNGVLGLSQLHLNYAGRVPVAVHRAARDGIGR